MNDGVPSGPDRDPARLRASDADRNAYVEVLQQAYLDGRLTKDEYDERLAAALSATTYGDLAGLLDDLPVARGAVPGPPAARSAAPPAPAVTQESSPAVALFSEVSRDSRWTVAADQVAVAAFGAVKLDLRTALLSSATTEIRANAIFGSIEITVPADILVQVDGVGAFGEFKRTDERTVSADPQGGPAVRVTGLALFGSVEVRIVDAPVTGQDRVVGRGPGPAIGS